VIVQLVTCNKWKYNKRCCYTTPCWSSVAQTTHWQWSNQSQNGRCSGTN